MIVREEDEDLSVKRDGIKNLKAYKYLDFKITNIGESNEEITTEKKDGLKKTEKTMSKK